MRHFGGAAGGLRSRYVSRGQDRGHVSRVTGRAESDQTHINNHKEDSGHVSRANMSPVTRDTGLRVM